MRYTRVTSELRTHAALTPDDATRESEFEVRRDAQKERLGLPLFPTTTIGSFPQTAEGLLPWSHAAALLERAPNYWLATVRPDGRPHVTPVWGAWVHGRLYLDGHPRTMEQIGQLYGLTRERIRQIEAKTMTKLRQPSRCQALRHYLD